MNSRVKRSPAEISAATESSAILDRTREAGQGSALLEYVQTGIRKQNRRRKAAAKAIAATLGAIALLSWAVPYFRDTSTFETLPARRQQLVLADGSHAELNAHTELKTDFRYRRRIVYLDQGEAFFSVVHDSVHPFLVETPLGTVRVTGTKFNVRLDSRGKAEVTLLEGGVNLTPESAGSPVNLVPGEQAELDSAGSKVSKLSPLQLDAAVAWRHGLMLLNGLTVADAAAKMADYQACRITVAPSVARIRLGGSLPLDNLPQFFTTLKAMGGIQVLDRGDGSYEIAGR